MTDDDRLPDVSLSDLRERLAGETDGHRIKRLIAIWEYVEGETPAEIEARYRFPAGTVEAWVGLAAAAGLDALVAEGPTHDPPPVTEGRRLAHTEAKLRSLQETTRALMVATTTDEIVDVTLDACVDVLGLPISVFWLYDEDRDVLEAYRQTEYGHVVMGTLPSQPFERGEGIVWRAIESGEVRYWEDIWDHREELFNPDTSLRSEIDVPLGEYGALGMGSMSPSEFDDVDVDMCRILGRAAESAFERYERERAVERKNEQLERTAEVISHDLRTPLHVGAERIGMLEADLGDALEDGVHRERIHDHLSAIDRALSRSTEIAEELLDITRESPVADDPRPVAVRPVATAAWEAVETGDLELTVRGSRTVEADEGRLRRLFENCFHNVAAHADADLVRVGATTGGFFVEDDGCGIPEDRRETAFERGVTTAPNGRGEGLAIVAEIADDYGWDVSAGVGIDGGARIEVTTDGEP